MIAIIPGPRTEWLSTGEPSYHARDRDTSADSVVRRLELDLDPPWPVLGEDLVRFEGRGQRLPLGEDPQGVHGAVAGPVHQRGDIAAVIAIAGPDGEVPVHRRADGKRGEARRIDADDGEV